MYWRKLQRDSQFCSLPHHETIGEATFGGDFRGSLVAPSLQQAREKYRPITDVEPALEQRRRVMSDAGVFLGAGTVDSVTGDSLVLYLDREPGRPIRTGWLALDSTASTELMNYLRATGTWTASDAQVQAKSAGLVHLIAGSPEYQLI